MTAPRLETSLSLAGVRIFQGSSLETKKEANTHWCLAKSKKGIILSYLRVTRSFLSLHALDSIISTWANLALQ